MKFRGLMTILALALMLTASPVFAATQEFNFDFKDSSGGPLVVAPGAPIHFEWDLGLEPGQQVTSLARATLDFTIQNAEKEDITFISFVVGKSGGYNWLQPGNYDQDNFGVYLYSDDAILQDLSDGKLEFNVSGNYADFPPYNNGGPLHTFMLERLFFFAEVSEELNPVPVPGSGLLFTSAVLFLARIRRN